MPYNRITNNDDRRRIVHKVLRLDDQSYRNGFRPQLSRRIQHRQDISSYRRIFVSATRREQKI